MIKEELTKTIYIYIYILRVGLALGGFRLLFHFFGRVGLPSGGFRLFFFGVRLVGFHKEGGLPIGGPTSFGPWASIYF
jgi:hypothetical protein